MSGRKWLWRIIQLVALALIGYFMYKQLAPELRGLQWSDLERYSPSTTGVVVSTLLLVAVYLMHAALWRHLASQLGGSPLSARDTVYVYFVSGLGRYLPGRLWQIAGLAVLSQRAGLQPVIATAAAVIAQLAFITSGLVLLAIVLPTQYGGAAVLSALILAGLAIGLLLLGNTEKGRALRHRLLHRLGARVAEAGALLDRVSGQQAVSWTVLYAFSWVVLGLAFTLFVSSFSAMTETNVLHLVGTVIASYVAGYLVLTPAGIGGRELAMIALLTRVMPAEAAVLIATMSRIWFTVGELAPLALVPLLPRTSRAPRAA